MLFSSSFFRHRKWPGSSLLDPMSFLYIWPVWDIDAISRIYLDWTKPDPTGLRQDRSRSHPTGISVPARWSSSVRTRWLRQELHSPCILFFGNPLRPILSSIFTSMNCTSPAQMRCMTCADPQLWFDFHGRRKWLGWPLTCGNFFLCLLGLQVIKFVSFSGFSFAWNIPVFCFAELNRVRLQTRLIQCK